MDESLAFLLFLRCRHPFGLHSWLGVEVGAGVEDEQPFEDELKQVERAGGLRQIEPEGDRQLEHSQALVLNARNFYSV